MTVSVSGDVPTFASAGPEHSRLERIAEGVFGLAMALPLLVWAWVGGYSRYTADDFCWAGILRTEGFLTAQIHYYTIYSPRYAFTFVVNVTELAGPAVVPALPATAIVVWLAALTWTFTRFGTPRLGSLLLAEVAAVATLQTAPDLAQSLYWQTGLLTYLLPLILATLLVGWVRLGIQRWWAWALSGAIAFVAGGLSETYLIPQNVALGLALLLSLAFATRRAHVLAALLGGVLALVVIVVAPATANRIQGTPADLWLAMSASVATAYFQVYRLVRLFPFTVLVCIAAPVLLLRGGPRVAPKWVLLVSACVLVTLPFAYFPSFYAQNGNPPARALIVPGAIMVGYLLFLGCAIRAAVPSEVLTAWPRALALAALAVVPVVGAISTLPDVASAARYAAVFDAEDQQIRATRDAGQTDLTVPPLPANFGENFVSSDRNDWFNGCVSRYYGVSSIAAR